MKEIFCQLTGNRDMLPYSYQEMVSKHLSKGKNLLLCAPTGAGKTWAAILPFLSAKKHNVVFADRLIYVLPLRTLATMLYAETVDCCKRVFKVKTSPDERSNENNEIVITIQTGEQKDDPFFEGDIIFTTIDQCLSSYLNMPVSLPSRLGNINAGALLGSLIVFDEFHLLEQDKAMWTALEMMVRLNPFSRFLIMTATLSPDSMNALKKIIDGDIVILSKEEVLSLPSHKAKRRTYNWVGSSLTVDDIILLHKEKRSIVTVNTVTRAQEIFKELEKRLKDKPTALLLLHSRFYTEHRKKTEDSLKEWFGKDAVKKDVILVTTQVIEAGVDISADNLHTELAPLNSLIQRAGRCARYEGERGIGSVWIYELETDYKGEYKLGPYRDSEGASIIANTREVLKQLTEEGKILYFEDEIRLLEQVHLAIDMGYLEGFNRNLSSLKQQIHEAMDGRNGTAVRELIRGVSSLNVIICHDPYSLKFDKKKWPRMLSIPRSSIYRLSSCLEECRDFGETVAWYPVEHANIIDDESDLTFGWQSISSKNQIKDASWLIVINPRFASYSRELGLQIGTEGEHEDPQYLDRPQIPMYVIQYETYVLHIQRVIEECKKMSHLCRVAAERVGRCSGFGVDEIEVCAELCCALHDVGKLSKDWQERIMRWQQFKNPEKLTEEPLAHSDYDPETDFVEKIKFQGQPPHASEGAYALAAWLSNCFGDKAIAIWTAIARHHGAFTESLSGFRLTSYAKRWIQETIPYDHGKELVLADAPSLIKQKQFADDLLSFSKNPDDERLWPLYVFLARRLRLADQKSQEGGKE